MSCTADACLQCEDGKGPNVADNGCSACATTPDGLKTCTAENTSTAASCHANYGLVGTECKACAITNCGDCDGNEAACTTCKDGYGKV